MEVQPLHHELLTQHILILVDGMVASEQMMGMFLVGEVMDMTMSIIT